MTKMHFKKRLSSLICAIITLIIFLNAAGLVPAAYAALDDTNIGINTSGGTWTSTGTTITGAVNGTKKGKVTGTLTITNNYSGEAVLSFKYKITELTNGNGWWDNTSSATVAGTSYSSSTSTYVDYQTTLASGSSITVTLVGGRGASVSSSPGKASISILGITLAPKSTIDVNFQPVGVNYSVAYYTNTTTAASPASVSTSAVSLTGEKSMGFTVTAAGHICVGANYTYPVTNDDGSKSTVSGYMEAINGKLMLDANYSVTPVFLADDNGIPPFSVDNVGYMTWETAFRAASASSSKKVILTDDYILPATYAANGMTGAGTYVTGSDNALTYKIPTGVTLLMPYKSGAETIETSSEYIYANATWGEDNANALVQDDKYCYLKLTMNSGHKLSVSGKLIIGGQLTSSTNNAGVSGATTAHTENGSYSELVMNGTMELNANAIVSSCGYITGNGTMKTMGTGASVYTPFVIMDFRGGGHTSASAASTYKMGTMVDNEELISPFTRYTMQNIQIDQIIGASNFVYGYCDLWASDTHNRTVTKMVGAAASDSLIALASGASLTVTYEPDAAVAGYAAAGARTGRVGKTTLAISGGATFGVLKLNVKIFSIANVTVSTTDYTFPVPYNYHITLDGGTYSIPNTIAFLPGSSLHLKSGELSFTGDNILFYDGLYDHMNTAAQDAHQKITYGNPIAACLSANYPTAAHLSAAGYSKTADLIIDGKLTLGSTAKFGGLIQTKGSGQIVVDQKATLSTSTQFGLVGHKNVNMIVVQRDYYCVGATTRTLSASVRKTDGTTFPLTAGNTYVAADGAQHTLEKFKYTLYTNSADTSSADYVIQREDELNANIFGSWYCGDAYHTAVTDEAYVATCDAPGKTEGSHCSTCFKVLVPQETIPALGHDMQTVAYQAATCTADGHEAYEYCKRCGSSDVPVDKVIPKLGHDMVKVAAKAATCTETGHEAYEYCSRCGSSAVPTEKVIGALGHLSETMEATDPTCTDPGYTAGTYCSRCKTYTSGHEQIPANGHNYESVVTPPTCTEQGYTTNTCTVCGDVTKTDYTTALSHSYGSVVTKPTCTAEGYTTYTCSACGDSYVADQTPATGHSWDNGTVSKEATCTATGTMLYTCQNDKTHTKTEDIPMAEHTKKAVPGKAATCTEPGLTDGKVCEICGAEIEAQKEIPTLGHDYKTVVTPPSCTEGGFTTYTCSRCGDSYVSDHTDPSGHSWENGVCQNGCGTSCTEHTFNEQGICTNCQLNCRHGDGAAWVAGTPVPKTCSTDGYTPYTCDICGKAEQRDIIPAGHEWVDASCTAPKTCKVCHTVDESCPALNHDYMSEVIAPSCTAEGYTKYTCQRSGCGHSYTDTPVAALGHSPADAVKETIKDATCTDGGSYEEVIYCSVCGEELSREEKTVAALGHDEKTQVVAATCTTEGYTLVTCSRCDYREQRNKVAALGHTEVVDRAIDATCTEPGKTEGKHCSVCGEVLIQQNAIAALGHDITSHDAQLPTLDAEGHNAYETCSRCGHSTYEAVKAALVGETEYAVLRDALAAAGDGGSVTLLSDISGDVPVSQNLTILTGGHSITVTTASDYYAAPEQNNTIKVWKLFGFYGTNIAVQDSLDINFFLDGSNLKTDGNYTAKITRIKYAKVAEKQYTKPETLTEELTKDQWTARGQYFVITYDGIAAKEMPDVVTIQIYEDGHPVSIACQESVVSYTRRTLDKNPNNSELRTVLVDMLNYGSAAQTHFGYQTATLANAVLTAEELAEGTKDTSVAYHDNHQYHAVFAADSVTIESDLTYTFYFDFSKQTGAYAIVNYTTAYGKEFKDVRIDAFRENGAYSGLDIAGLAIGDGYQLITCQIYDSSDTLIASCAGSIESYIAHTIKTNTNPDPIYMSMMKFIQSAYGYFH